MQHNDHLHKEIAKLRQQLEAADATISYLRDCIKSSVRSFPDEFNLSPTEAKLLNYLFMAKSTATTDSLFTTIWSNKGTSKIVGIYVYKLRKKLEPFNINIDSSYSEGYRIDTINKARLNACMEQVSVVKKEGMSNDGLQYNYRVDVTNGNSSNKGFM